MQSMKVLRQTMMMSSERHVQVIDITKQVRALVREAGVREGLLLVHALHTTCALFVNEFQGALIEDLKAMLERLVTDHASYKHNDPRYSDFERGNAVSHLRAALLGGNVALGINDGDLALGRFQSIVFAELDGPRHRGIGVQILGM